MELYLTFGLYLLSTVILLAMDVTMLVPLSFFLWLVPLTTLLRQSARRKRGNR